MTFLEVAREVAEEQDLDERLGVTAAVDAFTKMIERILELDDPRLLNLLFELHRRLHAMGRPPV